MWSSSTTNLAGEERGTLKHSSVKVIDWYCGAGLKATLPSLWLVKFSGLLLPECQITRFKCWNWQSSREFSADQQNSQILHCNFLGLYWYQERFSEDKASLRYWPYHPLSAHLSEKEKSKPPCMCLHGHIEKWEFLNKCWDNRPDWNNFWLMKNPWMVITCILLGNHI